MTPPAKLKDLSSAQTFLMKFAFPTFWIPVFGAATADMWLDLLRGKGGAPPPEPLKWVFTGVWVVGTCFILWMSSRLKRVRTDGKLLYVSNYLREIAVPLKKIADVQENHWIRGHPVVIRFYEDTAFGDSVTFLPPVRMHLFSSPHPVVEELRDLAGLG